MSDMKHHKLSKEDLEILNSKFGLYYLFKYKKYNLQKSLEAARLTYEIRDKQEELIKLQNWVIENDKKVVVLFEGRDAAGKTGAIRRITEYINPRHFRVIALNNPTPDERKQWYFQRYINQLPKPGEIVFFDRSWYNRAVVEPVNGFCTQEEYQRFMSQVNQFESMLIQSETFLLKYYFSISKAEQKRRFKEIKENPLKRWKMTPVDERAQELWSEYTKYKKKMFHQTDTERAPWHIIDANRKANARLEVISHILEQIPYEAPGIVAPNEIR